MPVLPLVASTTVCPGLSCPVRSASSMMLIARRSFTDDAGLKFSALTYNRTPAGARWLTRAHGVSPIVSTMLSYKRPRPWVLRGDLELIGERQVTENRAGMKGEMLTYGTGAAGGHISEAGPRFAKEGLFNPRSGARGE